LALEVDLDLEWSGLADVNDGLPLQGKRDVMAACRTASGMD